MALPLILDTDIGTDVDDALALAYAVRSPDIDLRAVTTVSGDTRRRAAIAATLLRLTGRDDVEVAAGLDAGPGLGGRLAWDGSEGEGLLDPADPPAISERDAVALLLDQAREVVTIGQQTNVAAALRRDPTFARRVQRLTVMGGVFAPVAPALPPFSPAQDHNLNTDPGGAVTALNAGMEILYVPGDVTVQTVLTRAHLERLRRGDPLCRALAGLAERWEALQRRRGAQLLDEQVAMLHDPLTIVSAVDRRFVRVERLPVTVAVHGDAVRTFVDPVAGTPADVVTAVAAPQFAEHLVDTLLQS